MEGLLLLRLPPLRHQGKEIEVGEVTPFGGIGLLGCRKFFRDWLLKTLESSIFSSHKSYQGRGRCSCRSKF